MYMQSFVMNRHLITRRQLHPFSANFQKTVERAALVANEEPHEERAGRRFREQIIRDALGEMTSDSGDLCILVFRENDDGLKFHRKYDYRNLTLAFRSRLSMAGWLESRFPLPLMTRARALVVLLLESKLSVHLVAECFTMKPVD